MTDRTLRLWVVAVTASAFGPYVAGGFRTEQLALYGSAALVVPMMWRMRPTPAFLAIVGLWAALVGVSLVGAVWTPHTDYALGSVNSGLDNMITPLCALIVSGLWSTTDRQRRLALDWLAGTATILVTINTAITIVSINRPLPWLRRFWAASGAGVTVAERSLKGGRVGGIFNSPAQCGLMCSIALILALWRWRWRTPNHRAFMIVTVAAVVGGLLAVSKVIFFAGIPVFVVLLWRDRQGRVKRIVRLAAGVAITAAVLSSGLVNWSGQERLKSWATLGGTSDSRLGAITAGRYGDGSTLGNVSGTVMREARWFGYGAQGVRQPLDSAWLEMLVVAGLFGLLMLTLAVTVMVVRCRTLARAGHRPESTVGAGLLAVGIIASFGLPAFTTNRGATILWLALGLAVVHVRQPSPEPASAQARALQRVVG